VQRSRRPDLRRRRVVSRMALGAVLLIVLTDGCSESPAPARKERPPTTAATDATRADLSDADLWLSFEEDAVAYDGSTEYPDALGGPLAGRVVTANDGTVERAPGADGSVASVAFPARCTASEGCPRAMVEVPPDPALDPGESDFAYGASVWLALDQTTTGSNILQKGRFGTDGGQWKLQVDSDAGEPSCVVRAGDVVLLVRSRVSIADSAWHRVVCSRDERGVSIRVDDTMDRRAGRTGSVANPSPVRVGSPGVGDHDDQFHGRIDDVFLRIDR
jgi:hypothetical protein